MLEKILTADGHPESLEQRLNQLTDIVTRHQRMMQINKEHPNAVSPDAVSRLIQARRALAQSLLEQGRLADVKKAIRAGRRNAR